ncbi:MAG: hypothetical protein ACK5D9_01625 [Burkholderiales bacterium]|jgi:hypothetical protein
MNEFAQVFAQFQDHMAPRLDVYEQAIYLYLLRHTHLEGKREAVIGFKSARKKMAFGIGKAGTPPSEGGYLREAPRARTEGLRQGAE